MIFHEGVSSCNSKALIVSHTMRGMAETTETNQALRNMFDSTFRHLPARITSTPAGNHRSPGRNNNNTLLGGNVRKYSASSTWVPSDSSTNLTYDYFTGNLYSYLEEDDII